MKLSILTAALPERASIYWERINALNLPKDEVEILALADNRALTQAEKWQRLLDMAQGEYLIYLDDDDELMPEFWPEVRQAIEQKPDVITFLQDARFNGLTYIVETKMDNPMGDLNPTGITKRKPLCHTVFRTELAKQVRHVERWDADMGWAEQMWPLIHTEVHIPKILHRYNFEDTYSVCSPLDKSALKRTCVLTCFSDPENSTAFSDGIIRVGLHADVKVWIDSNFPGLSKGQTMAKLFVWAIEQGYEQIIWMDETVRIIRHPRKFLEHADVNWWAMWDHSDSVIIADVTHSHVREGIERWALLSKGGPTDLRKVIEGQIICPLPYGGLCNNPDHLTGKYSSYFVNYGNA